MAEADKPVESKRGQKRLIDDEDDEPVRPLKRPGRSSAIPPKTQEPKTRPAPEEDEEPARPLKRPGRSAAVPHKPPSPKGADERAAAPPSAPKPSASRGVDNIVREHYNNVPQRGREWRSSGSKIVGLRMYNNWAKSVAINKAAAGVRANPGGMNHGANVLDIGCGKGGDLQKWAPQRIANYVGLDIADVSVEQARERYNEGLRKRRFHFHAEFAVKDCFSSPLADVPQVAQIGFDTSGGDRWGPGGGFDIVSIMFVMHYAFESEHKARMMLQNVSNSLKKGGKFVGVIPNSDVLSERLERTGKEWGNEIYRVRFPGEVPADGVFRPPFGWKYLYWLEEAVDAPEYVIPWESLRALAEDCDLELEYRKPLNEIWEEEKDDEDFGKLADRMRVRNRDGSLKMSAEEIEAASLYHAFIFYKV